MFFGSIILCHRKDKGCGWNQGNIIINELLSNIGPELLLGPRFLRKYFHPVAHGIFGVVKVSEKG